MFFVACLLTCTLQTAPVPLPIDGSHFVSVITADIDADGDLDVIASDRALQIHVWVNDGAGHFTHREPVHTTTWQALPPAPTFENRSTPDQSFAPPNSTPLTLDSTAVAAPETPVSMVVVTTSRAAASTRSRQAPRAPPLAPRT